jgi:hypothetical protein
LWWQRHADIADGEDPMRLAPIGDVLVTDLACTNPYTYRGDYYSGEPRKLALSVFKHQGYTEGMQLWYAPAIGGATRITAEEVDWSTSGIE